MRRPALLQAADLLLLLLQHALDLLLVHHELAEERSLRDQRGRRVRKGLADPGLLRHVSPRLRRRMRFRMRFRLRRMLHPRAPSRRAMVLPLSCRVDPCRARRVLVAAVLPVGCSSGMAIRSHRLLHAGTLVAYFSGHLGWWCPTVPWHP